MNADAAVEALARGMVVGVPTDTVYGLAVDPYDHGAVRRLRALKGRSDDVPLVVMATTIDHVVSIVDLSPEHRDRIAPHWPGALTAVLSATQSFAHGVADSAPGTLGVRIPDHAVLRELLEVYGPLAVTSANRSGEQPVMSAAEAEALFGDEVPVYLEGECPGGRASTVIDFTADPPAILREGPIVV